jgi:hypothetical protein
MARAFPSARNRALRFPKTAGASRLRGRCVRRGGRARRQRRRRLAGDGSCRVPGRRLAVRPAKSSAGRAAGVPRLGGPCGRTCGEGATTHARARRRGRIRRPARHRGRRRPRARGDQQRDAPHRGAHRARRRAGRRDAGGVGRQRLARLRSRRGDCVPSKAAGAPGHPQSRPARSGVGVAGRRDRRAGRGADGRGHSTAVPAFGARPIWRAGPCATPSIARSTGKRAPF